MVPGMDTTTRPVKREACGCAPMAHDEHEPGCSGNHWPHDACDAWVSVCRGGPSADCGNPDWHDCHEMAHRPPEWVRRARARRLPSKDYSGQAY